MKPLLFSTEFFSTISLACGPPARVPDGWTRQTRDTFMELLEEHFVAQHIPYPTDPDHLNLFVQQAYEFYYDWYERQNVRR